MSFKNARPVAATEGQRNKLTIGRNAVGDKQKLVEARVNAGMITMVDPADIPNGSLQLARNARCRFDKTVRRPGTLLLTPVKPNTNAVIGLAFYKKKNGQTFFLRFSPSTIHYISGGAWQALSAGVGGSLLGSATDRFRFVTAYDRFVFANNGVDVIQEFDTGANTYLPLGNAPEYKYITAFNQRLIGANLGGATPDGTQIGWSGNGNIDEWDPLVDQSAGFTPLVASPSDRGDFISGIFAISDRMVVLREKSIWLATKNPIPQDPFEFYPVVPGIGCDAPDSAVITLDGITWVDQRSGSVWMYTPGGAPDPIGRPIEKDLMRGLDDPKIIFAAYAPIENEYTVCIPQAAFDYVVAWTYNFRTKAWVRDEYEAVSAIDNIDLASAIISIDDLGDLPIDSLAGTIDDLSPASEIIPVRVFGRTDGEITQEDENTYVDPTVTGSANLTGAFTTELVSKTFTIPKDDAYFAEIRIEYVPKSAGVLQLYYSKDGGQTFNATPKEYTPTSDQLGKPQIFRLVKQIKCRRFAFKLASSDGQFELIGYEVHIYPGGESAS